MSETRHILDLPGIDGIEDLDGDVDGLDTHLNDLTPGNVVTIHDADVPTQYVVAGRRDSLEKSLDKTDIIELEALNPSETLLSRPMTVAGLHHRAARGEIEVETGWRGLVTWLVERGSYHLRTFWKYRVKGYADLTDVCDECGEEIGLGSAYAGPDDRPYHKECLADPETAVEWPDLSDESDESDEDGTDWRMTFTSKGRDVPESEVDHHRITSVTVWEDRERAHGEGFWVVDRVAGRWYCLACHDAHCDHAWAVENELPDPTRNDRPEESDESI